MLVLKRLLLASILLVLCSPLAVAQADPVQEFGFRLKDAKPDGRYTVVFTSRSYDTTGGPPPLLTKSYLRLAAGVALKREFLTSRYRCDTRLMLDALQQVPEEDIPFFTRVDKLGATLERIRAKLTPKLIPNMEVCARSEVGRGRVVVDARPFIGDPIPSNIFLYLSKPVEKGSVASFGILAILDDKAEIVKTSPLLRNLRVLVRVDLFNEPTPDGLYGYKLVVPTGPVAGVRISIAELTVTTKGVSETKTKTKCLKRARGKCVKKKVTKSLLFWADQPKCPASGKLGFQSYYEYETGVSSTKTVELPCPRFER